MSNAQSTLPPYRVADLGHAGEDTRREHEVVGQQHGERLLVGPDRLARAADGVAEPERLGPA